MSLWSLSTIKLAKKSERTISVSRGDWKCEMWHRETIEIVGTDIAKLENAAPYR